LTAFYKNLDCLVIPSLNNTETFGLVQIEAMRNGVPSVASALPGVRQPVMMTGMGEVIPIGDHKALAAAIIKILRDKAAYQRDSELIAEAFSPDETAVAYLKLFTDLQHGRFDNSAPEPPAYERLRAMRDATTQGHGDTAA
jgi:glycosyltransferase involved in cell wall biosynthesis